MPVSSPPSPRTLVRALVLALVSAPFLSACSLFFNPNDHVGGAGGDGGMDSGLDAGADGSTPDGSARNRGVVGDDAGPCPEPVYRAAPACGPPPTANPVDWETASFEPAPAATLPSAAGGALPPDIDLVVGRSSAVSYAELAYIRTTSSGPTLHFASYQLDGTAATIETDAEVEIDGATALSWVGLAATDTNTVYGGVLGTSTPGDGLAGMWLFSYGLVGADFTTIPIFGRPPVWGRIGVSGGGESFPFRSFVREPPGDRDDEFCRRDEPTLASLDATTGGVETYRAVGVSATCPGTTCDDGVGLATSRGAVALLEQQDDSVLLWSGTNPSVISLETTGRGGRPADIAWIQDDWYVVAYSIGTGVRFSRVQCIDLISSFSCCMMPPQEFPVSMGLHDRVAVVGLGGSTYGVVFVTTVGASSNLRIEVRDITDSGTNTSLITSIPDTEAVHDLAADQAGDQLSVALTYGSTGSVAGIWLAGWQRTAP